MAIKELEPTSGIKAYEPNFDRRDYSKKNIESKAQLDRYTSRQIEKLIGERLNVVLSKSRYEIKNNRIYGENMSEPFLNVMKRGKDYIEKVAGVNRVDREREEAEIDGFESIQDVLCNPRTLIGTMIVSISPPGGEKSMYRHNFYDIFTLKEEKGERFIEARRYSSDLSHKEYREKFEPIYPKIYGKDVSITDVYFLSHPVVIGNGFFQSSDEIHAYFHKDHDYMDEATFDNRIIKPCSPFIVKYIKALSEDPTNVDTHDLILNSILNKADIEADYIKRQKELSYEAFLKPNSFLSLEQEIRFLGNQPVRTKDIGCPGGSGGFGKNISGLGRTRMLLNSPYSVSDFSLYDSGEWFVCPKCNYKADGPVGDTCPGCGLTKEVYAQETGITCE